jgi:hypothetical protein
LGKCPRFESIFEFFGEGWKIRRGREPRSLVMEESEQHWGFSYWPMMEVCIAKSILVPIDVSTLANVRT